MLGELCLCYNNGCLDWGRSMEVTDWREVVGVISGICVTGKFKRLQRELEDLYRRAGLAEAAAQAYRDALLAMLAEQEATSSVKVH